MADTEARRQARIRKILQNSEARLNKITNVEQKSSINNIDGFLVTSPTSNDLHLFNETIEESRQINSTDEDVQTINENARNLEKVSEDNLVIQPIISEHKVKILVILAVVISCLLNLADKYEQFLYCEHLNNIFVPFLAYEIINEWFYNIQDTSGSNLNPILLFLLARNNSQYINVYLKYLRIFMNIMQDLMIYFFVFVCSYSAMGLLN